MKTRKLLKELLLDNENCSGIEQFVIQDLLSCRDYKLDDEELTSLIKVMKRTDIQTELRSFNDQFERNYFLSFNYEEVVQIAIQKAIDGELSEVPTMNRLAWIAYQHGVISISKKLKIE